MADLVIYINEKITLDNNDRGVITTQTIPGVSYIDNRIFNLPSGSITTLFSFSNTTGPGVFITSSVKYVRVTNKSTAVPIKLIVSSSVEAMSYLIATGSSYMLSTSKTTSSLTNLTFNDIVSIKAEPSSSDAIIEYFIATT